MSKKELDWELLFKIIFDIYKVSEEEILGVRKKQNIVLARQTAFFIARQSGMTYETIAERMNRTHRAVLFGCLKVKKKDPRDDPMGCEYIDRCVVAWNEANPSAPINYYIPNDEVSIHTLAKKLEASTYTKDAFKFQYYLDRINKQWDGKL